MPLPVHIVLSQGQSQNPVKRKLEEDIVAGLLAAGSLDVKVVPNLYDLAADGPVLTRLKSLEGDLIVLAWLYERATHWILDRNGVRGHIGEAELRNAKPPDDDEDDEGDDEDDEESAEEAQEKHRVVDDRRLPSRTVYCLDLRLKDKAQAYIDEVLRLIASIHAAPAASGPNELMQWISGAPRPEQMERYLHGGGGPGSAPLPVTAAGAAPSDGAAGLRITEDAGRRWYPVIDFSRCTNCMECIDFCLFGVYGVDGQETILVEQPDNCRKGCPACSRVCPENAIIFPQHKTPGIAGAPAAVETFKIDLSQLFGAPDALEVAARERDEQLVLAGRDAVGLTMGIPKRQADKPAQPADDLDNLIDKLDDLDL
jgi:NAD-dependent dihydropyrimidine dehydrogenase PreA subunit